MSPPKKRLSKKGKEDMQILNLCIFGEGLWSELQKFNKLQKLEEKCPKKILMISSYLVVPIQVTSCCRLAAFPHWTLVHIRWAEAKNTPRFTTSFAMENPPTTSCYITGRVCIGLDQKFLPTFPSTGAVGSSRPLRAREVLERPQLVDASTIPLP